tara:strand:- start:102 stop:296 length:195 start_codon:yes stop_codon:yes gene_type:complete
MSQKQPQTEPQKRISFDLRGENAKAFEDFRVKLAEKLGFNISPSKTVLWALRQLNKEEGDNNDG